MDYSRNVKFMQVPVVGAEEFIKEWVKQKMGIITKILEAVKGLSKRQVALYLLRKAGHGCRVIYYLRTTPRELIPGFVTEFDGELRDALQSVLGLVLDDKQWEQASFAVKQSGLGLTRAGDVADAAYIASRDSTFDDCKSIDTGHVWDDGSPREGDAADVIGEWLHGCVSRLNASLPAHHEIVRGAKPSNLGKQKDIMGRVNKYRRDAMLASVEMWDKARLEAAAASHSGSWLDAVPSQVLDTQLSNAEVQYGVGRRLGVQLCSEGPCPFCLGVMDRWGAHCESCMSGGTRQSIIIISGMLYTHRRGARAQRLSWKPLVSLVS